MKVGYQALADLQQQWAFKQWGYIESLSGTRDLNLPLAYVNRHLCVVATGGNTKGYGAIRAQTISLTQVRLYAYTSEDGAYSHYLSLGYQLQWGYGNSESTQTFPVKYPNTVIGIYGSKRAINYEYTFAATSITNTNFFMSTRNAEGNSRVIACNWLAIGQQQTR